MTQLVEAVESKAPSTRTDTAGFDVNVTRFTGASSLPTSIRQVTQPSRNFKVPFIFSLRWPELQPSKEPDHLAAL